MFGMPELFYAINEILEKERKEKMGTLPGEHYCIDHQGNHSHYSKENCKVCQLEKQLEQEPRVLQVGDIWYVKLPDYSPCRAFEMEVRKVGKKVVELSEVSYGSITFCPKIYVIEEVKWIELSQRKSQEIPPESP